MRKITKLTANEFQAIRIDNVEPPLENGCHRRRVSAPLLQVVIATVCSTKPFFKNYFFAPSNRNNFFFFKATHAYIKKIFYLNY